MRILILLTLMLLSEPVFSQEGVLEKNVKAVIELKYEREKKELDEFKAKKLADNNPLFTNMYLDSLYKALAQSSKYNHSLYDVSLLLKEYSNLVTYPKTDSLTSKIAAKFELLRTYDEQIKPMAFLLTLPTDFLYSLTLSEINSELKNALPDLTRENVEMKINKEKKKKSCIVDFDSDLRKEDFKNFRLYIVDYPTYMLILYRLGLNVALQSYPNFNDLSKEALRNLMQDIESTIGKLRGRIEGSVKLYNVANLIEEPQTMPYINTREIDDARWYAVFIVNDELCFHGEFQSYTDKVNRIKISVCKN